MTLLTLAVSWLALATLVGRRGARLLLSLGPRAQATAAFAATAGLVLVPVAAAAVVLDEALGAGAGAAWVRCGRLVVAMARDPLARPDVSAALLLLLAAPIRLGIGATRAWCSQARAGRIARDVDGPVVVVPSPEPVAFTAGLLRPRVVVSSGLLDSVPEHVVRVVLAHEEAHRRGRHPFLLFCVEALAQALPLPPVRRSVRAFRVAIEALADEHAARTVGSRALAAEAVAHVALMHAVGAPLRFAQASAAPALGFEGDEVVRVRRLLEPPGGGRVLFAAAVVSVVLGLVAFAGAHAVHCAAEGAEALGVVQCRAHQ